MKTFADYNAMYGSIGAIIVLLLYFYISAAVLLLGAEMNAVIEHMSAEGKNPGEKAFAEDNPQQSITVLGHEHPVPPEPQTREPNT